MTESTDQSQAHTGDPARRRFPAGSAVGMSLNGVSHAYGDNGVLQDVSLEVGSGEVACLLGPSGCGKTTLLRLIAGLEVVQHGRIDLGGRVVADAAAGIHVPPEERDVGLMFQDYALFPHLTVRRNVAFGLGRGQPGRERWVDAALERVGLAGYADRYPHTLSGGQQQRVALLRALAPEPRLMLLDEPFSGLDVGLRVQVRNETMDLLHDSNIASIMVTHDPEEAMAAADTIMVMEGGRIVQRGTPEAIYLYPANGFVANLFGPVNRLEGRVAGGQVITALGRFPAPGLPEGAPAKVLIRHEGLNVVTGHHTGPNCVPARLESVRLMGRTCRVRLRLTGGAEPETTVEARILLDPQLGAGDDVWVAADGERALVFPES